MNDVIGERSERDRRPEPDRRPARPAARHPGPDGHLATDQPALAGLAPGLGSTRPPGWIPAPTRSSPATPAADLLDAAARRWHATPHAAAALAWKCYSYWLSLPAVLGYAVARRVPLMTPDAVPARWSPQQPFLTVGLT